MIDKKLASGGFIFRLITIQTHLKLTFGAVQLLFHVVTHQNRAHTGGSITDGPLRRFT